MSKNKGIELLIFIKVSGKSLKWNFMRVRWFQLSLTTHQWGRFKEVPAFAGMTTQCGRYKEIPAFAGI